jgi:hypothetical protein
VDDLLPFNLIGPIFGGISTEDHHHCEQAFLVGGVEKKPLVSGVTEFNMAQEDPIVYPTSLPRLNMDLGARSLVSGVDCNDPEKSQILELLVLFIFRVIVTLCILMHL